MFSFLLPFSFNVFDYRTIKLTANQAREIMEEYKGPQYEIEMNNTVSCVYFSVFRMCLILLTVSFLYIYLFSSFILFSGFFFF